MDSTEQRFIVESGAILSANVTAADLKVARPFVKGPETLSDISITLLFPAIGFNFWFGK